MDRDEILEVLEELGAERVRAGSNNVQLSCPLATWRHDNGTDRSGSMGIRINPGGPSKTHCFACKWGSDTMHGMVDQLAQLADRNLDDLVERVAAMEVEDPEKILAGIDSYDAVEKREEIVHPEVYLEDFVGVHRYFFERGFDEATAKTWGIGYDSAEQRIVFPVRRRDGALVGAIGRDVTGQSRRKYHNYWEFKKGRYLYGEWLLPEGQAHVVIVEGTTDALRVWQETRHRSDALGLMYPLAILGSEPTQDQVKRIVSFANQVTLFLDNDGPGKKGRDELAKRLGKSVLLTGARYPADADAEAKDPDGLGARVVEALQNLSLLVA